MRNVSPLEVLRNRALQIDIYLLTYLQLRKIRHPTFRSFTLAWWLIRGRMDCHYI